MFSELLKRETRVQNKDLLEHQSWYSQEMKLQYYLKFLNVTELVTQMQSIIQIKIFTSNIIDLRGGGPFQKHCGSVLQRAVNRQPGYRSGNSKGRSPPASIFQKFWNFQKSHNFPTFWKSLDPIELWNFKVVFNIRHHFYKLQYLLQNYSVNHTTLPVRNVLQKLLFHDQEHLRAAAPSCPLSDCFGMATSGKPSTRFLLSRRLPRYRLQRIILKCHFWKNEKFRRPLPWSLLSSKWMAE